MSRNEKIIYWGGAVDIYSPPPTGLAQLPGLSFVSQSNLQFDGGHL